ncbi:GNAT family N-acetyltransferase [Azospirillum sp. sgz302134]
MNLVFDRPAVVAWVVERIPHVTDLGQCAAIGLERGGRLRAGVVYHNYRPLPGGGDCEITAASDTPLWARPANLRALLTYPFVQLGCHRITTVIPARNARARRFNESMGFVLEGTVRQGFGTDDATIYGLLRSDAARWLGE